MNFLASLLKALIPTALPIVLTWLSKQSGAWFKSLVNYFKNRSAKKDVKARRVIRENIVKQIELAAEKDDHDELEKLHVALHVIDSTEL